MNPKIKSLFAFFSTPLGLMIATWFTTVVISNVTTELYSDRKQEKFLAETKLDNVRKLESEISYRVKHLSDALNDIPLDYFQGFNANELIGEIDKILLKADCLGNDQRAIWNVVPQLRDRRIESLIYELESFKNFDVSYRNDSIQKADGRKIADIKGQLYAIAESHVGVTTVKYKSKNLSETEFEIQASQVLSELAEELKRNYYLQ